MSQVVAEHERATLDRIKDTWPFTFPPLVIDVGANVGDWTAEVLERFPRAVVLAFEPQRGAHAKLHARFDGNSAVAALRLGVSSEERTASLTSSSHEACVLATLHDRDDADNYHGSGVVLDRTEEIRVIPLDSFAPPRVHLLKIDVEGHELDVLRGGVDTLHSTDLVQFEFNDCAGYAGYSFADLHAFLTPRFRLFREHVNGLELVEEPAAQEWLAGDSNRDYLAVARDCDWFR